jgi:AraC family transcriptional regulator of adaptative response/methylated-DNA-[protein]-cysteine methyltransferase
MTIYFTIGGCSLGSILVAQSQRGICAVLMGDDRNQLEYDLRLRFPKAQFAKDNLAFEQLVTQVIRLIETPTLELVMPLDIGGTTFQQRVWQAIRQIPLGQTISYSELAENIGSPRSARAVAHACAANTLAVLIPCHRVVRLNGSLSGYRWGVQRKAALLAAESQ